MKKVTKYSLAAITSLLLISCGESKNESGADSSLKALKGKISIDGSSTVFPISEAIGEEYDEVQPEVQVIVNSSGTGGGFKKFVNGETDLNDASRSIKEREVTLCEANNVKYQELTVAYDGLAVVINPKNTWASTMTVEELKKLWEPAAKGVITKWSDVRAGWPEDEIKLYGPGPSSGTFDYFTLAINGEVGASRNDYSPNEVDNVLVNGVANDLNALGYFGLSYYEENENKLKVVAIDNGDGPVKPSLETVKSGTYSPLSRPLFIYVSSTSVKKEVVKDFVTFYLTNAKDIVTEVGYIPLKDSEYAKQQEIFKRFCSSNN